MSDETDERKISKIINLAKLHPSDYRIWVSTAEATLNVYNCLDIVKGTEPNPTPATGVTTPAVRKTIASWINRHALAREALLRCLERSELIKVHDLQLASQIWARLKEEYGNVSDALHAKAEYEFHSLRKLPTTSIQTHVNEFTRLLADTQYHAPPGTPKMTDPQINLAFLRSLGKDFETFQQAMGNQTYTLKPGELYAKVRAIAESKDGPSNNQQDEGTKALVAKTLTLRISDNDRRNGGPRGRRRGFRGGLRGYNGGGQRSGRISKRFSTNFRNTNFDGNKACRFCKKIGHTIEECRKLKYRNRPENGNGNNNNGDTDYRPSPNFQVNVTRFIANNASISPHDDADTNQWIVDSASNANLTPFRFLLHNYKPYSQPAKVQGIGGKFASAIGSGSVTLMDHSGNKYTIKNVLYVPDHDSSLLSMMQLRNQGLNFAFKPNENDGAFTLSSQTNDFHLDGKAVDNILYTSEAHNVRVLAVTTRKRARMPVDDDALLPTWEGQKLAENEIQPIKYQRMITPSQEPIRILDSTENSSATSISPRPLRCTPDNLWHLRFVHASKHTLAKHPSIESNFNTSNCIACLRGKQHKNPYHASESLATEICERIHSDVCGPFVTSKGGSQYIVTFLDDVSHYLFVYTVADKSSVTMQETFKKFITLAKTQTGKKVKHLRTDGGGEYIGKLTPFLESMGTRKSQTSTHRSVEYATYAFP